MLKTAVVLALFFCAAFAAPTEQLEAVEAGDDAPEEPVLLVADAAAQAPEDEEDEEAVAEAPLSEEAAPAARFNFCPAGWFFHGSRCFLFVHTSTSWYNAEEHCNSLGAHLPSVSNPTEYRYLQEMTQTAGQSYAWLGSFYLQGRWLWIDREGMYYTNWHSQTSPATSNSCTYLTTTVGWRTTSCASSHRFICTKSPFTC